jgi:hypothetical protein
VNVGDDPRYSAEAFKRDEAEAERLVELLGNFLATKGPAVQSMVLGQLMAKWLAGHHRFPQHQQDELWRDWKQLVERLLPIYIVAARARGPGAPPNPL